MLLDEALAPEVLVQLGEGALYDRLTFSPVLEVVASLLFDIREIPFHRHVGFPRDEDVGIGLHMRHVGLEKQASVGDCFVVAPSNLAVTERAVADLRGRQLTQVLTSPDTEIFRDVELAQAIQRAERFVTHCLIPVGAFASEAGVNVDRLPSRLHPTATEVRHQVVGGREARTHMKAI